jgi:hypothetical protein
MHPRNLLVGRVVLCNHMRDYVATLFHRKAKMFGAEICSEIHDGVHGIRVIIFLRHNSEGDRHLLPSLNAVGRVERQRGWQSPPGTAEQRLL